MSSDPHEMWDCASLCASRVSFKLIRRCYEQLAKLEYRIVCPQRQKLSWINSTSLNSGDGGGGDGGGISSST